MAATPTAPTRERFDKAMLPPKQSRKQQASQHTTQQDAERPTYNPPETTRHRHENHARTEQGTPSWFHRIFSMFQGTIRPEQQRFFSISHGRAGGGGKTPRQKTKSIMKRRRLRDIAHESRKVNRHGR